jgi:hypothetical protein
MTTEALKVNVPAFFIGMLSLALGVVGLAVLTLTQQPLIGLPLVFLGIGTFITVMMMCAKTTGGPQD